jgi:flavin reductase (DIM6/NTAB) family NADH-FMN oxidoreductase RutF/rubredoxin
MNHKALHRISYGLYIVTSGKEGSCNGQIANTVIQVTSEPVTVAVSVNKQNFTHEYISKSRVFAVSILAKHTPLEFIGRFGFKCGRDTDKFQGTNYKTGKSGVPIVLDSTVAYVEAKVIKDVDMGTHTIFIGEVIDADILTDEEPMTYAYYHQVKGGATPRTAPTYLKEEDVRAGSRYRCTICGYIYDPARGDPESGIAPGTPFEQLPENWICPLCGAVKDQFEKIV